ncbi:MAG: DUF1802 family protein, partial [Chthoniobacterales bacterium]
RKGGIAEGRSGFRFQHAEFFLFPTFFHEQVRKTRRADRELPAERAGEIEIQFFARVEFCCLVTSWEAAITLEPFHILTREVVQERFEYGDSHALHLAAVRVFRFSPAWIFPELQRYGGCRSWVRLPEAPTMGELEPVLDEEEHRWRLNRLRSITVATAAAVPHLAR